MKRLPARYRLAVVAMTFLSLPGALAIEAPPSTTVTLRLEPAAILAAVARHMNVALRDDVPVPQVFLASTTSLRDFQKAVAKQWGFEPHAFSNAYVAATNQIYLMDDAAYYRRRNRSLDDSLAHEFVHYLQVQYLKADLTDPSLETDAIAIQERFRSAYTDSLKGALPAASVTRSTFDIKGDHHAD